MSSESEALKERTMSFAVRILQLIETFPKTIGAQIVAGQLADAATSVGANYGSVCTARSDREFVACHFWPFTQDGPIQTKQADISETAKHQQQPTTK
jgi:hypothetical protein